LKALFKMSQKITRIKSDEKNNWMTFYKDNPEPDRVHEIGGMEKLEMLRQKINEIIEVVNDMWNHDN